MGISASLSRVWDTFCLTQCCKFIVCIITDACVELVKVLAQAFRIVRINVVQIFCLILCHSLCCCLRCGVDVKVMHRVKIRRICESPTKPRIQLQALSIGIVMKTLMMTTSLIVMIMYNRGFQIVDMITSCFLG